MVYKTERPSVRLLQAKKKQKRYLFVATLCITVIALVLVGIAVGVGKSSDQNTTGKITTNSQEKDLKHHLVILILLSVTYQIRVWLFYEENKWAIPKGFSTKTLTITRKGLNQEASHICKKHPWIQFQIHLLFLSHKSLT